MLLLNKQKTKVNTGWTDNDGNMCPVTCPTVCPWEHKYCPGGLQNDGCGAPATCIHEPFGLDGNKCYVSCPPDCTEDQMVCPGGVDPNGCPMPDTCIPLTGIEIKKFTSS